MVDFQPQFLTKMGSGARLIRTMNWDGLWSRDWTWASRTRPSSFGQMGGLEVHKRIGIAAPAWIGSDDIKGVAVEHKVDLANQNGQDLWMCLPTFADTSHCTALGTLVNQQLAAGKKLYAEFVNEAWNHAFPMHWWMRWLGLSEVWDEPSWTQRTPSSGPTPTGRRHAQIRYDTQRLVLFGGEDGSGFLGETWTYTEWPPPGEDPWVQRTGTAPSARARHAMSTWYHDVVNRGAGDGHGIVLIFGGIGSGGRLGDTWEWNSNTLAWTQRTPASAPSARSDARMCFDVKRGVVVLFGGDTAAGYAGDTWEWDGTNWAQVATSGPSARSGHHMVYDEYRQVVVMFGGENGSGKLGDTWEWDGSTWTLVATTGISARSHGIAVYDGGIRVFGGLNISGNRLSDTVQYKPGSGWVTISVPSTPPARAEAACCFDPHGQRLYVFGGSTPSGNYTNDNWTLSGDVSLAAAKALARRHVQCMSALESVMPSDRLKRIFCWQSVNSWNCNIALGHEDCAAHTDFVGIAPYIGYDQDGNQIDTSGTVDDIMTRVEEDLPRSLAKIDTFLTMLQAWPGIGLALYEFGQHVVAQQGAHEANVFAAMDSTRMETVYANFLAGARQRMGALAPMAHYSGIENWGSYGQWGVFRKISDDVNSRARYRPIRAILSS